MLRRPRYWQTTFGSWVNDYGVSELISELGRLGVPATSHAVHDWLSGRRLPHPTRAIAITEISEGKVSLEDVYRHRSEVAENDPSTRAPSAS